MTTQGKSLGELGRRAVACRHWRWMPGMLLQWRTSSGVVYRGRVCNIEEPDAVWCEGREDRFDWPELPKCWPDLSDPATLGCLLALVEDAYGTCDLGGRGHPSDLGFTHRVFPYDHDACFEGRTRAEALVIALEAAP